jgi:hypothetical protein
MEVSVHTIPKSLQREFHHVFERQVTFDSLREQGAEILAILTNQHALEDLISVGDRVEKEKDRLLNVFIEFARPLCHRVSDAGFWADFIDPCSGLPMRTENCNKVYSEVDGMECCLGYKSYNAGFCKILIHPKWQSAVYPASIFVCAPRQLILQMLQNISGMKIDASVPGLAPSLDTVSRPARSPARAVESSMTSVHVEVIDES